MTVAAEVTAPDLWPAIDRLVADADLASWDSAELDPSARDDWAKGLVQSAAFLHVAAEPGCTGYTLASSGRVSCGLCGWRMSGCAADSGTVESARFVYAALGRVGAAVELAVGAVVTELFEAVLPC